MGQRLDPRLHRGEHAPLELPVVHDDMADEAADVDDLLGLVSHDHRTSSTAVPVIVSRMAARNDVPSLVGRSGLGRPMRSDFPAARTMADQLTARPTGSACRSPAAPVRARR